MKNILKILFLILFAFNLSYSEVITVEIKDYQYQDALDDLRDSILSTGTKITETRYIEKMLKRTKQNKSQKDIYKYGMAYSFCKADLSREMMSLDARNIANCPFTMALFQEINSKKIYLSYRVPTLKGDKTQAKKVRALIKSFFKKVIAEAF